MRVLLPEPLDARTRRAMVVLFFAQSGVSLVAAALLVLLQVGYVAGQVPTSALAAWTLAFAVLIGVRARWRRQAAQLEAAADLAGWERRALAGVPGPVLVHQRAGHPARRDQRR